MAHLLAGGAEDERRAGLVEAQHVHDRELDLARRGADGAVGDVDVRHVAAHGVDAHRVLLVVARELGDLRRDRSREQQRATLRRRGLEDEGQVLAKAEDRASRRPRRAPPPRAATGRARPRSRWSRSRPGVPTTMSAPAWRGRRRSLRGSNARPTLGERCRSAGLLVEPGELRRSTCSASSRVGAITSARGASEGTRDRLLADQRLGQGQAEGHGLAGAGLGRDGRKVAPPRGRAPARRPAPARGLGISRARRAPRRFYEGWVAGKGM